MATALIEVSIWGHQVGAVARDDTVGAYVFEYAPAWRRRGIELAPLLMPVTGTQTKFVFPTLSEPAFKRLPGMLADALPDDFGNALIDAWMARQGVDKNQVTTLDRLAYMGKRGKELVFNTAVGAVVGGAAQKLLPGFGVKGVSAGAGNMKAVAQGVATRIANGTARNMTARTAFRGAIGRETHEAIRHIGETEAGIAKSKACAAHEGVCH